MSVSSQGPEVDYEIRRRRGRADGLDQAILAFAIMIRALIGFHSHSGQDGYEGSKVAYGGDFEAQRHWMELTWHLPIGDWYWYDLEYWGLDYPPLTAYISYICGGFTHYLIGSESIALYTSRGIEDPIHKAFMRSTVLLLDICIFGTAVWYASTLDRSSDHPMSKDSKRSWIFCLTMSQPAILLIDHGHFQYNTVALGLSIVSFYYMAQPEFKNCILGSIFFCLALNFKQMTLYFAPAIFFYLLGRCGTSGIRMFVSRILKLGVTVITTFSILWAPVIYYGPPDTSYIDRLSHVLKRVFPFQRGLFEGKVANLWCVLSTKPIRIRERFDPNIQPILALILTMILITPACIRMFQLGMEESRPNTRIDRHWIGLLWGTMSTALSFFLASFQVHEKSILLALAPCSLLVWQDPMLVDWFSFVSCWTLWPLLQTDRLQIPYVCCILLFVSLVRLRDEMMRTMTTTTTTGKTECIFDVVPWVPTLCYAGMLLLHLIEMVIPAPANLPDIHEVLWSAMGCGMFCIAWFITCIKMYTGPLNKAIKRKTA